MTAYPKVVKVRVIQSLCPVSNLRLRICFGSNISNICQTCAGPVQLVTFTIASYRGTLQNSEVLLIDLPGRTTLA